MYERHFFIVYSKFMVQLVSFKCSIYFKKLNGKVFSIFKNGHFFCPFFNY